MKLRVSNWIGLAVAVLFCVSATAQEEAKLIKGNHYFEHYSFSKAIEQFESLTEKNTDVNRKLADSYRLIGNTVMAESYYETVVAASDKQASDYFYYAQMLKSNGKYRDAQKNMKEYRKLAKDDSRAEMHLKDENYHEKLMKDEGRYSIRNLDINTTQADFGAAYWNDRVVYASTEEGVRPIKHEYNWNNKPFLDLYVADKAENGDLSNREPISKLNSRFHEGTCAITRDGKRIWFTRNNFYQKKAATDEKGTNKLKLYRSEQDKEGEWMDEVPVHFNNDNYSCGHPALSKDGKWLYFASDMPGGIGGVDIYKVEVKADGTLGAPQNLGAPVNTEGNEMFPFVHAEGNLFFASDGHPGLGGLDVFMANATATGFGKIINMGAPLNTGQDDFSLVLDDDMKKGYFASNRSGGKGDDDIYAFELLKPLKVTYLVKGYAKEKRSGATIPGATVTLKDASGNKIGEVAADDKGYYQFEVEPEQVYTLKGTQTDYFDGNKGFDTKKLGDKTEVTADVILEKDPGLSLYCLVTEKGSGAPIENVHIVLIDNMTDQEYVNTTTGTTGDFRKPLTDKKLDDRLSYQVKLEAEGYLAKTVTFNHKITEPGEINMHEKLDFSLDKIDVGMDLAKIIDINPIYFDLNKSNIRPDAAAELQKIVDVMNENPTMEIELGSHTDCRASKAYNEKLSDRRAKSSAKWVQERITNPERIYGKGYGESQLVNQCECEGSKKVPCTEEEHQANRRTEFKIIKM